jgi:hypothetical protein
LKNHVQHGTNCIRLQPLKHVTTTAVMLEQHETWHRIINYNNGLGIPLTCTEHLITNPVVSKLHLTCLREREEHITIDTSTC